MYKYIKDYTSVFLFILIVISTIYFSGNLLIFIIPFLCMVWPNQKALLYTLVAFFIILPFADSSYSFAAACLIERPILLFLIILLVFTSSSFIKKIDNSFYSFLPFSIILIFIILSTSVAFIKVQKSISYILVLWIIPVALNYIVTIRKELLLKTIVVTYSIVYVLSFLTIQNNETLEAYGRFSGIFSNPNSLGIFSFLFFMQVSVIFQYYPTLFSKSLKMGFYLLIIIGLLYSRSRSGIFATILYVLLAYSSKKLGIWGMILSSLICLFVFYFFDIVAFMDLLGLKEFLRLDSLEQGSGRKIAFQTAIKQILEEPIWGKGIGYTEVYFSDNMDELASLGHVGGVHNSYLWIWLDTGIFGLLTFIYGWFSFFKRAFRYSFLAVPIGIATFFSTNVEQWLGGSLNNVTIQLLIILTLLSSKEFYSNKNI